MLKSHSIWHSRTEARKKSARSSRNRTLQMEWLEDRALLAANQVAAFGDYGQDSPNEAAVAAMVDTWNVGAIAALGDNNYLSPSEYDLAVGKYYSDYIGNYKGSYGPGATVNKFWPALGNHDYDNDPTASAYLNYFTLPGNERYYDWVLGNAHFFVINSEPEEPDGNTATSAQAMWLKDQLAKSTSTFNIVYDHRPPYSSSPTHGSQLNMEWPYKAWGADLVMSGHVHNYERLVEDGLTYIVSGAGGFSATTGYATGTGIPGSLFRYNLTAGSLRLTFSSTQILGEFFALDSTGSATFKVIDSFTISASGSGGGGGGTPSLSIADASQMEGDTGTSPMVFSISLSTASTSPVTVHYATADGTAAAGVDYVATSGNLTFAPGVTQESITVSIIGDTLADTNEDFLVNLTNSQGATLADSQAVGTIVNDDTPKVYIVNAGTLEGNSGTHPLAFAITLSVPVTQVVTVGWFTSDNTATAGSDYKTASGTVTFQPGQTQMSITVQIIGDTTPEPNETFNVNLRDLINIKSGDSHAVGSIIDDDGPMLAALASSLTSTQTTQTKKQNLLDLHGHVRRR